MAFIMRFRLSATLIALYTPLLLIGIGWLEGWIRKRKRRQ